MSYFVCESCNAKWFQSGELRQCPRCGTITGGEKIEAPWTGYKAMNTVADIAKRLRVSERMVYKLVETGQLRSYKIGSAIRISDDDVDDYLAGCRTVPSGPSAPPSRGATLRRLRC